MAEKRGNSFVPKDYDGGESLNSFHQNFQILRDIEFMKKILPATYSVQESNRRGSIHCKSSWGIRLPPYTNSVGTWVNDAEDEEKWGYVFKAMKAHFGDRFQEVFHNTCAWHSDFTVFLKPSTTTLSGDQKEGGEM